MNNKRNIFRNIIGVVMLLLAGVYLFNLATGSLNGPVNQISSSEFMKSLEKGEIDEFSLQYEQGIYTATGDFYKAQASKSVKGKEKDLAIFDNRSGKSKHFEAKILPNDDTLKQITRLAKKSNTKQVAMPESQTGMWLGLLAQLVPFLIVGFFIYSMTQATQGGAKGPMSFGRTKVKDVSKEKIKVRFSDVAGAEEEKQELVEVVEFLKDPKKFTALGARIPAGVLLEGPPGTGKTLLAKAVAGEAGVPFFSISGSEFVEMFVGVGASRVRDLFDNAKKNAPAIIFIDEIDAVGRQRGAGMGGGHDEREQTLNQLLVEMDGFSGNEGIIVIAATNRSDVLDPALLRPGRFDRQILVGRPDVKGREAILRVHARNKKLKSSIDLKVLAQQTPGFSGADLENLLNEAALLAARLDKKEIDEADVDEAHDRVIAGPAKRDKAISEKERRMVAFHEAGHTICGLVLSDARIVHKVTIVPRGRAGGYAIMLPKEDRFLMTKRELLDQVVGLLGGRAAEQLIFDALTTGASNDFEQATGIVRSMVTEYGMSDKLGTVQYEGNHQVFIGRDYGQTKTYSEQVAFEIDSEIQRIMRESYQQAIDIISSHQEQLHIIAEKLLELETLDARQIKSLFETGKMPEDSDEEYKREHSAKTFEESKKALENKERERRTNDQDDHTSSTDSTHEEEQKVDEADGKEDKAEEEN
ncbi:ATP-dependent zinc metalloprotease FtsH [Atopobacter sp. AH10]|uniref:ATP-dependent zinc metalloprotease FtsH n=1 Tax=Atopobacter sp. AH10 TaxID=2315861 RepID=UPI000EF1AD53|nr:ATP-dependent zinc metalloprotease FtsH [Atopobacter sp. AH10]RLK63615.1 ATP-dependent zinc metalloprotease FtsH [Atopobacter sp. AH10]